jgi:branched-chain amino acid transport system substrate-binding protein
MTTTITLGAVYNLTGGQAGLDVPSANGARLAVTQANAAGVLGGALELIVLDGATEPAVLASQTAQLLADRPEVCALFGLSDTDAVLAAAGACASLGRLFVTSGATSPLLPRQVPMFLYLACFGDNVQAAAAAEFAYHHLAARSATVIYRREDTFTELLQGYFAEQFTTLGGDVPDRHSYTNVAEIDLRSIHATATDIIYLSAAPEDVIAAVSRLRAAGVTAPILGGDSFDLGDVWHKTPGLSGIVFTTHALVDPANPNPAMTDFITAYEQANPGHEANAFAALGYDTVRLILAAIETAGSADATAVLAALPTIAPLPGLTGTIHYADGSRIPNKDVTVLSVDRGQVTLASQIRPTRVPQP